MNERATQERKDYAPKPLIPAQAADKVLSEETDSQEPVSQDTISDLFQDRDHPSAPESPSPRSLQSKERSLSQDNQAQDDKTSKTRDQDNIREDKPHEPRNQEQAKKEDVSQEIQTLKEELTKTQKRLTENQQYGRQNAQRLKNALKLTREFVEEGSLSEEEAAKLMVSLDSDAEDDLSSYSAHPFGKVLALANRELENIRKYTDDAALDDKVRAFDYFLLVAAKEEQEQALEDLTEMSDNPLKLAKAMLERGQRYEKSYQEMKAAGSLYELLNKKDQDMVDLRKNLDKLTKKLAQYEDYDKPRYRLDEMGEGEETASTDSISSLFDDRDRVRRR